MTGDNSETGEGPCDRQNQNLGRLEELGFGPDSILMNDPKLFLDWSFLSIIKVEFGQELGPDCSIRAQLEIGRHHGLSEARKALTANSRGESEVGAHSPLEGPSLVMQFSGGRNPADDFTLRGAWPEGHEARATLARLGQSEAPNCHMSAGYTAGWLSEIHNGEVEIAETACRSTGAPRCEFVARIRRSVQPEPELLAVDPISPEPNTLTAGPKAPTFEATPYPHIDPQDDAVHAWGPVMVLPCSEPELAESTLLGLEQDPFIRQIRAVIIDLRGEALNSKRSRLGIERILKTIDRWGAQAIFSGVSESNQAVLECFGSEILLSHRPLPEAIAMGFQVAEAQRHAV